MQRQQQHRPGLLSVRMPSLFSSSYSSAANAGNSPFNTNRAPPPPRLVPRVVPPLFDNYDAIVNSELPHCGRDYWNSDHNEEEARVREFTGLRRELEQERLRRIEDERQRVELARLEERFKDSRGQGRRQNGQQPIHMQHRHMANISKRLEASANSADSRNAFVQRTRDRMIHLRQMIESDVKLAAVRQGASTYVLSLEAKIQDLEARGRDLDEKLAFMKLVTDNTPEKQATTFVFGSKNAHVTDSNSTPPASVFVFGSKITDNWTDSSPFATPSPRTTVSLPTTFSFGAADTPVVSSLTFDFSSPTTPPRMGKPLPSQRHVGTTKHHRPSSDAPDAAVIRNLGFKLNDYFSAHNLEHNGLVTKHMDRDGYVYCKVLQIFPRIRTIFARAGVVDDAVKCNYLIRAALYSRRCVPNATQTAIRSISWMEESTKTTNIITTHPHVFAMELAGIPAVKVYSLPCSNWVAKAPNRELGVLRARVALACPVTLMKEVLLNHVIHGLSIQGENERPITPPNSWAVVMANATLQNALVTGNIQSAKETLKEIEHLSWLPQASEYQTLFQRVTALMVSMNDDGDVKSRARTLLERWKKCMDEQATKVPSVRDKSMAATTTTKDSSSQVVTPQRIRDILFQVLATQRTCFARLMSTLAAAPISVASFLEFFDIQNLLTALQHENLRSQDAVTIIDLSSKLKQISTSQYGRSLILKPVVERLNKIRALTLTGGVRVEEMSDSSQNAATTESESSSFEDDEEDEEEEEADISAQGNGEMTRMRRRNELHGPSFRRWLVNAGSAMLDEPALERMITREGVRQAVEEFVRKALHNPTNQCMGRKIAAKGITRLFTQSFSRRHAVLKSRLNHFDVELRQDSRLCNNYIRKSVGRPLEEVVAITRITSYLFGYGHATWSENHHEWEDLLIRNAARDDAVGWEEVTDNLIATKVVSRATARRSSARHIFFDYYDYDDNEDEDYD